MKLRIHANTLRFRLEEDEVSALADRGYVEESVRFGLTTGEQFVYRLQSSDAVEHIDLQYRPGNITVLIPRSMCQEWKASGDVGFEENAPVGDGSVVALFIERELACKHKGEGTRGKSQVGSVE